MGDGRIHQAGGGVGALLADLAEPALGLDPERGDIVEWNAAAEVLLGVPLAEAVGQPVDDVVAPGLLAAARARRGGPSPAEGPRPPVRLAARTASGGELALEASVSPLWPAPSCGRWLLVVLHDATARERALSRASLLAEVGARLVAPLDGWREALDAVARALVPALADWCAVDALDADGAVRRVASAHADPLMERELRTLWEDRLLDLAGDHPSAVALRTGRADVLAEAPADYADALAQDAASPAFLRRLGTRSRIALPLVARGRTFGVLTLAYAGSGRRYDARDLALVGEVGRLASLCLDNARLHAAERATRAAAEAAAGARDAAVGYVAHDVRGAINSLRLYAEALAGVVDAGAADRAAIEAALGRMAVTAARADLMISDLVDAAREQPGPAPTPLRAPLDLAALARAAARLAASAAGRTVQLALPDGPLTGEWDAAQLERVLLNLLDNALRYSPAGGEVMLSAAREADGRGDWAVVRVADHGLGIPEADLPHIFDRFHRGANVAGRIRGTGLGLAGAQRIVEAHGGEILVASAEGRGTTVTVRLPLGGA